MRWSSSDEMDYNGCSNEPNRRLVKVAEWYKFESISVLLGRAHLWRSNPAVPTFTTELLWSHYQLYVNRFYVVGTAHISTDSDDYWE